MKFLFLLAVFFISTQSSVAQISDLRLESLHSVSDSLQARSSRSIKWKKLKKVSSSGFNFWTLKPTSGKGKYHFSLKYGSNKKLVSLELLDSANRKVVYEFEFYYYNREFVFFDVKEFAWIQGDTVFYALLHQRIILNLKNQKLVSLDPHNGITMLDSLLRPIAAIQDDGESIIMSKVKVVYNNTKATLHFYTPSNKPLELNRNSRISDLYHLLDSDKEFILSDQSSMTTTTITPYNFEKAMKFIWSSTKK
jgi:hypothetical protein